MSFINNDGSDPAAAKAIQHRDLNWRIPGDAPAPAGETRIYFGTQGPSIPDASLAPPALTDPTLIAEVARFAADVTELGIANYEGVIPGTGAPVAFNYTGGTATGSGGPPIVTGYFETVPFLGRYNMTTGLSDNENGCWLESPRVAPFTFSYNFSLAVSAFGTYLMDLGDFSGATLLRINAYNGATQVYASGDITNPKNNAGNANGNLAFWGIASTLFVFTRIEFVIQQDDPLNPDIIGFDVVTVGNAAF